jgi:SAM-dependent methyltransferase
MSIIKQAYSFLKSKAPKSVINQIDIFLSSVDPILISFYRLRTGWINPIPPFELRKITAKRSVDNYVQSGKRIVDSLVDGFESTTDKKFEEFPRVLDFGCGAGRQIQYFYDFNNLKITGCDPNQDHIQWLSNNYPQGNFRVSNFFPPLPFADQAFDLIYAVSVFTHLSETAQDKWLEELQRVLRPGGVALLTTLGFHNAGLKDKDQFTQKEICEPESFTQTLLEKKFFFYVPDSYRQVNKSINPESQSDEEMYGIAWHSPDYIREYWGKYFKIVSIIDGCIDSIQDLVILEKQ